MAENKCTLSNEDMLQQCEQWVHKLAKSGGVDWCLQVPVNFNRDPDMLFMELINRFKANVQQGALWVKASDRLPGVKTRVKWRLDKVQSERKYSLLEMTGPLVDLYGYEWLDESGCEAKKALEG